MGGLLPPVRALFDANDLLRSKSIKTAKRMLQLGMDCSRHTVKNRKARNSAMVLGRGILSFAANFEGVSWSEGAVRHLLQMLRASPQVF